MSSGSSPTKTFQHIFFTIPQSAAGTYKVYSFINNTYTIKDTSDGTDDLTRLGDIASDMFQTISQNGSTVLVWTYFGETVNKQSVIARPGPGKYLFTNNNYSDGATITIDRQAFLLCFVTGTLIRTERGDVAVEALAVGDVAITRDGRRKPIRWIGHRHVACDRHPEPAKVHPVRVRAGSFGEGLPYADLWLSRNHALCLDNALVPVRGLIDGDGIAQVPVEAVTYWHVELDGHDVILANGLPAESYLDTGNRRGFENAEAPLLHFAEEASPGYDGSGYCLPMIESGPRLSAIRARYGLGRSAAVPAQAACAVHLVADEAVIAPCLSGENELRFVVPAGACELRLVSPAFPAGGADIRRLGVIVGGLAVSDGAGWRAIGLDDAGLYAGFHAIEREAGKAWRWTDGEAHLSPGLWAGLTGPVLLRLTGQFTGLAPAGAAQAGADERLAA